MANTTGDARKTDPAPESTWGATEEAKAAWDRKYGKAAARRAEEADGKDKEAGK